MAIDLTILLPQIGLHYPVQRSSLNFKGKTLADSTYLSSDISLSFYQNTFYQTPSQVQVHVR